MLRPWNDLGSLRAAALRTRYNEAENYRHVFEASIA